MKPKTFKELELGDPFEFLWHLHFGKGLSRCCVKVEERSYRDARGILHYVWWPGAQVYPLLKSGQ